VPSSKTPCENQKAAAVSAYHRSVDLARVWPLPACAVVAGCASILGIPSDSPSFCARPENQGHDYCEDFDVGDALGRVGPNVVSSGQAKMSIEPSDASPPNLIDFLAQAAGPDGGHEVVGYYKTWNKPFVGLRIDADMKLLTQGTGRLAAPYGFMLIGSSPGACLGLAAFPWPSDAGWPLGTPVFSGILVPQATGGCESLVALGGNGTALGGIGSGGGGGDAGPPQLPPIVPVLDNWFHLTIQIAPSSGGDGSGVLLLRAGLSSQQLALPKGTVPSTGLPIVGFAAAPQSGTAEEVQIDNVTIDVAAQQLP
jgi:hypothetical protein